MTRLSVLLWHVMHARILAAIRVHMPPHATPLPQDTNRRFDPRLLGCCSTVLTHRLPRATESRPQGVLPNANNHAQQ